MASSMNTPREVNGSEESGSTPRSAKTGSFASTPVVTVWRRRWIVAACAAIGMLLAAVYILVATPTYTAATRIIATTTRPRGIERDPTPPQAANLYTELSIISSSTVLSDAAALLDDPQWYWDNGYDVRVNGEDVHNTQLVNQRSMVDDRRAVPPGAEVIPLRTFEGRSRIYTMHKNLQVDIGRDDQIITLGFDSPYPLESAIVANAITSAYINFSSGERHTTASGMVRSLEAKHEEFQRDIAAKDQAIGELSRANPMLYLSEEKSNPIQDRLAALNQELTAANVAELNAKQVYENAAREYIPDPFKRKILAETGSYDGQRVEQHADSKEVLLAEIAAANEQLQSCRRVYLENHPAVAYARQQVERLNASYVIYLQHQYEMAKESVGLYQKAFDDANAGARELSVKRKEYADLLADRQNTQKMIDALETRMKEIHVGDDPSAVNVRVLEPAGVPQYPSRPQKLVVLFEGMLLGLLFGIGASLLDQRILVEEEAAAVELPVIGLVPPMARRENSVVHATKVFTDPMSEVAEAFNGIRGALIRSPRVKTLLVTSAVRGEGKSTIASNLAMALSRTGRKVLLIDADLRDPSQSHNYDTQGSMGLSGVLVNEADPSKAIVATNMPNLSLLPCGEPPHNPGALLDTQAFADLLQSVSTKYDYVVIDSPPILPVADARILGSMCDATILVIRAGTTRRRGACDARDGLLGFGTNVLGMVINDCRHKRSTYPYYQNIQPRSKAERRQAETFLLTDQTAATRKIS